MVERPDLGGWTGGSVWASAEVLARLISQEPDRVRGKRVLELGTGCGLVGLAAGALGAREVALTDQVLFMAAYNLDAYFPVADSPEFRRDVFRLRPLRWGDPDGIAALEPPFRPMTFARHHINRFVTG